MRPPCSKTLPEALHSLHKTFQTGPPTRAALAMQAMSDTANSNSNSSPRAPETPALLHPTEFGKYYHQDLSCFSGLYNPFAEALSASQAKLFVHVSKMLGIAPRFLDYHDEDPGSILDRLYYEVAQLARVQGGTAQTADLLRDAFQYTAELSGSSSLLKLALAKRFWRCAARTRPLQRPELTHLHVALNLDADDVAALIPVLEQQLPRIPRARLDGLRDGLDLLELLRTTGYFPLKRERPEDPEPDLFLERLRTHLSFSAPADRSTRHLKHALLVFTHADELAAFAATSTKSLSLEKLDAASPELPVESSPTPVELGSLVHVATAPVSNPLSPPPAPVHSRVDTFSPFTSSGELLFARRMPRNSVILSHSTTPSANADQLDVGDLLGKPPLTRTPAVNIASVGLGVVCASGGARACVDPMPCVDPVPAQYTTSYAREETVAAAAAQSIALGPLNAVPATTRVHRTCAVSSASLSLKTIHPDVRKLECTADLLPHSLVTFQQYVELARTPDRYPRINEGPTDGRMFIFNCEKTRGQQPRPGSLHDMKLLRALARHPLGFRRWLYKDLERDRFKQTLARALRRPFPPVGGVFWLVIMGHGNQDGIMCADGDLGIITYAEIRHWLSTAPALSGVPKIVTIVSCRHSPTSTPVAQLSAVIQRAHTDYSTIDEDPDDGLDEELDKVSSESPPTGQTQCASHQLPDPPDGVRINMPEEGSDILLTMSTIEGFVSLSTSVAGSPFIFHLCNEFSTRAAQEDAHVMLARVNNLVSRATYGERHERMQPVFSSTLGGPLYLARAAPASDALMQTLA